MTNFNTYKKQEAALILLNIGVLASLFFVHISFISLLGRPTFALLLTLAVRFLILIFELMWIERISEPTGDRAINIHIHLSIALNIVCAFLAARFGSTADSHYSVLMIIPIISAAYRFNLTRTLVVIAVGVGLNFLEVWLFFRDNPPTDVTEYFEAATVSLVFLVVGVVVWLLVGILRSEEEKLSTSLGEMHVLQERLVAEEKFAAVGQLSSAIAHEIRNPVTMIASSLKMAAKAPIGSPLRLEMFNIATEEAKRLEDLTSDFLAFARSKDPELQTVVICDSLRYIADLAKAHLLEKSLTLEIACTQSATLQVDPAQVQQALLNLLMNAVHATPANGRIEIGARRDEDNVILWVENNGDAITDEIAAKMFEPFFSGASTGTGLGLSIVQKVALAHGGRVYLAHNERGKVRFEMEL